MIEHLAEAANGDNALRRWGRRVTATILVGVGDDDYLIDIDAGRVTAVRRRRLAIDSGIFAIRAEADIWAEHWRALPKRGYHDLYHLFSYGHARIDGDLLVFMQNLLFFKMLLAAPRRLAARLEG